MSARFASFTFARVSRASATAAAQNAVEQPQTPPNAGAAEAQPSTVTGPGSHTSGRWLAGRRYFVRAPSANGNGFRRRRRGSATRARAAHQPHGATTSRRLHAPPLVWNASHGEQGLNYLSYAARAAFRSRSANTMPTSAVKRVRTRIRRAAERRPDRATGNRLHPCVHRARL